MKDFNFTKGNKKIVKGHELNLSKIYKTIKKELTNPINYTESVDLSSYNYLFDFAEVVSDRPHTRINIVCGAMSSGMSSKTFDKVSDKLFEEITETIPNLIIELDEKIMELGIEIELLYKENRNF